ncbi:MAG: hypothetical protein ACK514_12005 [Bacteroidota bacterium]|jgi:hypothetical protein|nr:hypothetical protein [Cytophagales bacterium]MCE2957914.1 hypothetical protein [Flammeovirgaceae bacterium]MCZ8070277.1 hypothetical protein [Cytophagales bacterium]
MIRVLLAAFNVAIVTLLVYRLVQVYRSYSTNKSWILSIGIFIILLPSVMLLGFIRPSMIYILIYPVAIGLFLFFIKDETA